MFNFSSVSFVMFTASKVQLDLETNRDLGIESTRQLLDNLYRTKLEDAMTVINEDILNRGE